MRSPVLSLRAIMLDSYRINYSSLACFHTSAALVNAYKFDVMQFFLTR